MIKSLTLTNFRNHKTARIDIRGAKNIIITGPNGAGKTAILEAISMLSGDRGMRGSPMAEVANFNSNGSFCVFSNLTDDTEVCINFESGDTNRHAIIDGDNARLSDLSNYIRAVWITPKEDRLFVDSVSERRAYFDKLVSGFDTNHSGRSAKLSKLLSMRAFALKNGHDNNWMSAIELQIAASAVAVAAARIRYGSEINYFLENSAVSVSGLLESMLLNKTAADTEQFYLKYLSDNRELVSDKMTIDGAHKSDFGVYNKILKLPANLTSTGQQKSVLIDLILAHAKLIRTKTNKIPVVLLDEADAHLDADARNRMFRELYDADAQIFATGIDVEKFKDLPDALFVSCTGDTQNNIIIK